MLCVFLCCTDTEVYDPVFWNGRASEARLDWAPHTLPRYENKTKLDCGNSDPERFQFFFPLPLIDVGRKDSGEERPFKELESPSPHIDVCMFGISASVPC